MTTAFRPGVRLSLPGSKTRVSLPMEFCIKDNGPGVPDDLLPHLFDPFVTTKPTRHRASDLHWSPRSSAIMAASSNANRSRDTRRFRVLMPMYAGADEAARVEMPELVGE